MCEANEELSAVCSEAAAIVKDLRAVAREENMSSKWERLATQLQHEAEMDEAVDDIFTKGFGNRRDGTRAPEPLRDMAGGSARWT